MLKSCNYKCNKYY